MKLETVKNAHLLAVIRAKGYTLARLSKTSNVPASSISRQIRGLGDMKIDSARRLAMVLDVDPWDVYHDKPIEEVYG